MREAGALRDLERLVQDPHRRLELQMLVRVDRLAIEQSDLADRRAVSIFRLGGRGSSIAARAPAISQRAPPETPPTDGLPC